MEFQPLLPSKCQLTLNTLPIELVVTIFQNLSTFDQIQLAKTSKKFYKIYLNNRNNLLQKIFLQNIPLSAKNIEKLRNLTNHPTKLRTKVRSLYTRNCGISRSTYERDFAVLIYLFESSLEKLDIGSCHPSSTIKGFTPKYDLPAELDNEHTRFNGFSDEEDAEEDGEENEERTRESQNTRQHRRNGYQRQNMVCHIGDGVVQAICLPWSSHVKCENLKHLSLPLSKLHNPRLDEFNGRFKTAGIFNHMRHLDLSYISEIYDDSLSTLFKQNPGLLVLKLKSCLGLNGDCLFHLGNNCELLRELDLGYCTEINPDTGAYNLRKMLERKPNLRKLDLTGMRQLKDAHMNQILIKTGKLVSLDLSVTNVSPDSLRLIARSAYRERSKH